MTADIALTIAVLTSLLAILAYIVQKYVDRRNALVELKRKKYSEFMNAFMHHLFTGSDDSHLTYHLLANELPLYASVGVLKSYAKLQEYGSKVSGKGTRNLEITKRLIANLHSMMKKIVLLMIK